MTESKIWKLDLKANFPLEPEHSYRDLFFAIADWGEKHDLQIGGGFNGDEHSNCHTLRSHFVIFEVSLFAEEGKRLIPRTEAIELARFVRDYCERIGMDMFEFGGPTVRAVEPT